MSDGQWALVNVGVAAFWTVAIIVTAWWVTRRRD